jgi:hypothetical protein
MGSLGSEVAALQVALTGLSPPALEHKFLKDTRLAVWALHCDDPSESSWWPQKNTDTFVSPIWKQILECEARLDLVRFLFRPEICRMA